MSELPSGWVEATLDELVAFNGVATDGDWVESKDQDPNGEVRLTQLADVGDGEFRNRSDRYLTLESAEQLGCTFLEPGDVLIARMPDPLGRACIFHGLPQPAVTVVDVLIFRSGTDLVSPHWIMSAINAPETRQKIVAQASGTTRQRISGGNLKRLPLPLPPLAEQKRIVAKLNALSAKSSRARTELSRIETLVSHYKQAVLNNAFSGDLTRVWRMRNSGQLPGPSDQSHLHLDDGERGLWFSNNLPAQWEWRAFGDVFIDLTDSKRKLPQKDYLSEGKYPVVDQGAPKIGGYTDRPELLHPADAPFIVFGDHTRCVKYIERRFVQGADGVKVFHAAADILLSFAYLALSAVELPNKGYSRHMKFVRSTVFPVAPLLEQHEIVRRIESAFAKIDGLAGQARRALELVGRLDEAVLAKAFRGELVPQNENDEPAGVLLARIKQTRISQPTETKNKTPKRQVKVPDMARTIVDTLVQAKDWLSAQELFERCGVRDGSSTEDVEKLYRQLLELERQARVEIEEVVDFLTGAKQGDRVRLRK